MAKQRGNGGEEMKENGSGGSSETAAAAGNGENMRKSSRMAMKEAAVSG